MHTYQRGDTQSAEEDEGWKKEERGICRTGDCFLMTAPPIS